MPTSQAQKDAIKRYKAKTERRSTNKREKIIKKLRLIRRDWPDVRKELGEIDEKFLT